MEFRDTIARQIASATGRPFTVRSHKDVGGGCINNASILIGDRERYFVKTNSPDRETMFTAEFAGLEEIQRTGAVRVPEPVCVGTAAGRSYIVIEHLDLGGKADAAGIEAFGQQIAALHRCTRAAYGWDFENTIGSTPQHNHDDDDWTAFWREQRLGFQLELAASRGYGGRLQRRGERLLDTLPAMLAGHTPQPALLHGDLWSGNYAFSADGTPVIFDPAVYYGDREADIAMTELFGGFPPRFYQAYNETWPLEPGYELRKTLYNLYHVLNHLNLFGSGYQAQAEGMIESLLSELR